jgi:hypothetical protein
MAAAEAIYLTRCLRRRPGVVLANDYWELLWYSRTMKCGDNKNILVYINVSIYYTELWHYDTLCRA